MLLPPAFFCEMYAIPQSERVQRPKLYSFGPYEAPMPSPQPRPAGLLSSCRALQSILGGPVQANKTPSTNYNSYVVAIQPTSSTTLPKLQLPAPIAALPRGANKRRRDEFEEDFTQDTDTAQTFTEERNIYQTPKRQRFAPEDMPLGLNTTDFDSLITPLALQETEEPDYARSSDRAGSISMPAHHPTPLQTRARQRSRSKETRSPRSPDGDRSLIEAVLSKLNLLRTDQTNCATQLAQDTTTIGERWNVLAGR